MELSEWLARRAGLAGKKLDGALKMCADNWIETVSDAADFCFSKSAGQLRPSRLVIAHTPRYDRSTRTWLLRSHGEMSRRRVARDVCAALVALHGARLSCGGHIYASNVAVLPQTGEAVLCTFGACAGDPCVPDTVPPDAWAALAQPPDRACKQLIDGGL